MGTTFLIFDIVMNLIGPFGMIIIVHKVFGGNIIDDEYLTTFILLRSVCQQILTAMLLMVLAFMQNVSPKLEFVSVQPESP